MSLNVYGQTGNPCGRCGTPIVKTKVAQRGRTFVLSAKIACEVQQMSFVLGVTGGIATGKSTAVAHFRSLGLPIIDADIIAREVVEPNTEGLQAVTQAFGPQILTDDGHLDRQTLGALIFNDPEKRRLLNQTLSPFIRQEILSQIEEKTASALVDR